MSSERAVPVESGTASKRKMRREEEQRLMMREYPRLSRCCAMTTAASPVPAGLRSRVSMSSSRYPPDCPGTLFSADGTVPLHDRCGFGSWQGAHSVCPKIPLSPCCYRSNDESAQGREEAVDGYIQVEHLREVRADKAQTRLHK